MKIIDCHVHSGFWIYKVYRNKNLNINVYMHKYKKYINKVIVMPSEDKDNDELQYKLKNINNTYKLHWYDPHNYNDFTLLYDDDYMKTIVGLKVHASIDRIINGISSNEYIDILDYASRENLPILVHTGNWKKTSSYKHIIKAAKEYKNVKFIMAHCGGKHDIDKYNAINDIIPYKNIYIDTSATKYPYIIEHAVNKLGSKRILFGSDWPIMCPLASIEVIKNIIFNKKDLNNIFFKNAERIFNLKN